MTRLLLTGLLLMGMLASVPACKKKTEEAAPDATQEAPKVAPDQPAPAPDKVET